MTRLRILAAVAALAIPASALAQPYSTERIAVYEHPRYERFVLEESAALHSGGNNLEDTLLADSVAMALARDRELDDATVTVSANRGRVSLAGLGDPTQSDRARQIAERIAGRGNVSGELSSSLG